MSRPWPGGSLHRRRRGIAALIIALGGLAAGSSVTAASAPATTPPEAGEPVAPDGLGNDPSFDALAEACFGGDLESCDELYWGTEVGSAYEEYGSTCGGRLAEGVFGDCVATLGSTGDPVTSDAPALPAPTVPPTGLGSDPTLDGLAQECYDGAMFACDKLFVLEEEGSAYYDYGYSCAGRQAEGESLFCHELLGFPPPGIDFSTLPSTDDDDEYALIASCTIGDMAGCDDLYRQTDDTSPYRALADTCAGRQAEGTGLLCTNAFPEWEQLLTPPVGTVPIEPAADLGEPTDPTGLGTDPSFDALAQSCFDGDLPACDDLFWRSPIGSDYESYGATCGGRLSERASGQCAEQASQVPTGPGVPAPTAEPTGLGTDESLNALAQDCYDGAMFACDRLFVVADDAVAAQTPYDTYGDTCAGRQPPSSGDYCHQLAGFPPPTSDLSALPTDDAAVLADVSLCVIGDMAACDDLYRSVAEDSPFRELADTCAGRQPVGTNVFCATAFPEYEQLYETGATATSVPGPTTSTTPAPPASGNIPAPTQEPTGLGSDPAMDAYAQACYAGDMQACDDLFQESPLDSAYETYGDTCAGRQPASSGAYCVDTFPG